MTRRGTRCSLRARARRGRRAARRRARRAGRGRRRWSTSKKYGVTATPPRSAWAVRDAVSWNGRGRPSSPSASASPSSTNSCGRQRPGHRDHLGQARGDVVEAAGRDLDVVAAAVDLDPDAVELHVDRHRCRTAAGLLHRGGDVGRARGEHRQHRPADLEPDLGQGRPRRRSSRPPRSARCRPRAWRHGVRRSASRPTRPRSPPAPARRGRPDGRCRSAPRAASAARRRSPAPNRSRTPDARASCDPGPESAGEARRASSCDLEHGQGRLGGRLGRRADAAPADAGAALEHACRRGRPSTTGSSSTSASAQPLGDRGHLGLARPGGRDDARGLDDVAQQHGLILPEACRQPP